jgi:kumamolisin
MTPSLSRRTAIPNSKPQLEIALQHRPVSPNQELEVTLLLRGKAGAAGDPLASGSLAVLDRRHLELKGYFAEFGADPGDIDAVSRFAAQHRLKVVKTDRGCRTMVLRGRAGNMARAFGIGLVDCERSKLRFLTHTDVITLPAELNGVIVGVFGLDNRPVSKRPGRVHFEAESDVTPPPVNSNTKPPAEIARLYGFPNGATGKNQCIAVLEFGGGFKPRRLHSYLGSLGIEAPRVIVREIAPGANKPLKPSGRLTPDVEVYMDLEIIVSAAPGATVVVYFAANNSRGWIDALHAAIFDKKHRPSVLSISWGQAEEYWDGQTIHAIERLFQAAARLGVTICCSSGDHGVMEADGRPWTVPYPASSPHVLACGGTRLDVSPRGALKETVWNQWREAGLASGGGISQLHPLPPFQRGYRIPARPRAGNESESVRMPAGRGIPDVSANASTLTGYLIWSDGVTMSMGGTSAAAPLWAALIACLNEALGRRIGYLTPLLYSRGALDAEAVFSVVEGNNKSSEGKGYNARKEWDACTGLGSPRGGKLLKWLKRRHAKRG